MKSHVWLLFLPTFFGMYFGGCHPDLDADREPGPDIMNWVRRADFVFEGEVIKVEYKNSLPLPTALRKDTVVDPLNDSVKVGLINDRNGGVLVDTGEVPHTFVTYRVLQPFKGNFASTTEVTLRFAGGLNTSEKVARVNPVSLEVEETHTITEILRNPQFDVGDHDFVFAHRNGQKACPLVDCDMGRFRVLQAEGDTREYIFDEWGSEVHQLEDENGEARLHFPFQRQIPEVNTHFMTYPNGEVRKFDIVNVETGSEGDSSLTSSGLHEPAPPRAPSPEGVNRHEPFSVGPDAPDVVEQPATETRIAPGALAGMLRHAVGVLYPGGMTTQPEPVSADIGQDFEIGYLRGEISSSDPVEQDRPNDGTAPVSPCSRIEAAVMAEARIDVASGRGNPEADVRLSADQIQRIREVCDREGAQGETE